MDSNQSSFTEGNSFWDFTNPNLEYVSSYENDKRIFICKGCPEFIQQNTQCKQCGCLMKNKTRLKHMNCPLGKW
jgi:hypothetical protein